MHDRYLGHCVMVESQLVRGCGSHKGWSLCHEKEADLGIPTWITFTAP